MLMCQLRAIEPWILGAVRNGKKAVPTHCVDTSGMFSCTSPPPRNKGAAGKRDLPNGLHSMLISGMRWFFNFSARGTQMFMF